MTDQPALLPQHEALIRASGISPEVASVIGKVALYQSRPDQPRVRDHHGQGLDLHRLAFPDFSSTLPLLVRPARAELEAALDHHGWPWRRISHWLDALLTVEEGGR